MMFISKKVVADQKGVLWDKYSQVYDTLNEFYPYAVLKMKVVDEIKLLINEIASTEKTTIIEIGCGTGNILEQLKNIQNIKMIGIDKYRPMLEIAKNKFSKKEDDITLIKGDADVANFGFALNPVSADSVDIALLNLALFNIDNKEQLLENINGLLKKGGFLLICDFKPDNQKKILLKAHIKNKGIISFLKNASNSIKINKYTEKIFNVAGQSPFRYLSADELTGLFKKSGFDVVKVESVYEDQATMIIGKK